jgi:hypothetical protein
MLALVAFVAAVAPAGLRLEVAAGLGGVYRPGLWMPVAVTITNQGEDIEGVLEVELDPVRVSMPVSLAAPSRKRFELVLPTPPAPGLLQVRLRAGESELEPSAIDLEPLPPEVPLELHVLTGDEVLLRRSPLPPVLRGARSVSLPPEDVPDRWKSLEAARAVVLSGPAFQSLRESQRKTLRRFQSLGGRVLVEDAEIAAPALARDSAAPLVEYPDGAAFARRSAGRIGLVYLVSVAVLQVVFALARTRLAMRFWITGAAVLVFAVFLAASPELSLRDRSVIHVVPQGEEAYVETLVSLAFGRRGSVSIEAASRDVFFEPVEPDRGLWYESGSDGRLRAADRRFRWERDTLRVYGFVETPFRVEPARLSNLSKAPLTGCALLHPEPGRLPDVPAGGIVALPEAQDGGSLACDVDFVPELLSFPAESRATTSRVIFHLPPRTGT